jgi:hypothetical protein
MERGEGRVRQTGGGLVPVPSSPPVADGRNHELTPSSAASSRESKSGNSFPTSRAMEASPGEERGNNAERTPRGHPNG